jgi:RNAse (barnase) inhibitor barstar
MSWECRECFNIVFEAFAPLLTVHKSFTGALDSAWLCLCGALVMPLGCVLVTSD